MRCKLTLTSCTVRSAGWIALVSLLAAVGACQSAPEQRGPNVGVAVGLKRGGAWTTFNVMPSRVMGPDVSLEMKKGEIRGFLNGSAVKLKATANELTGVVGGRVALDVFEDDGHVEISGTWNDDRVHFEVTPESLRGNINGAVVSRIGHSMPWHCQYVLDRVETDGARSGVSICSGMPQQTRLEFPSAVDRWLGRAETVVVLLALLASAPPTMGDSFY